MFFLFFSFVFHTKIRLHSNIAIHMWHPLSDESSLTSPIYETRSGSQKTHSNTDRIFKLKLKNSSVSVILLASDTYNFFYLKRVKWYISRLTVSANKYISNKTKKWNRNEKKNLPQRKFVPRWNVLIFHLLSLSHTWYHPRRGGCKLVWRAAH